MNDFEKLGQFIAERFYIDYYDSNEIFLGLKNGYGRSYCRITYSDFLFLKRYIDVVACEDFEDER